MSIYEGGEVYMATAKKVTVPIEEMISLSTQQEFTVLDIETTGLSPTKGGFIIEIAAVRISKGEIVGEFSSLVDPKQKLYGKTIELTGITNDMVIGQPTYGEVLPKLYNFIGDSVIVAHNAMFDWDRFLVHYFSKLGLYPKNKVLCTKRVFQYLRPERRKLKLGYGLSELTQEYGIHLDENEHHRALVDTKVTALAFLKMRNEYFEKNGIDESTLSTNEMENQIDEMEKIKDVTISTVRYWEKTLKSRVLKRVYVQFNYQEQYYGTAYYDIPTNCWFVKEFDLPLDLESVEELVLRKIQKDSMNEYLLAIGA